MRSVNYFLGFSLSLAGFGCETVHVGNNENVPIAFWMPVTETDQSGNKPDPQARDLVSKELSGHGVHAKLDEQGVSVPTDEALRACEVLLTDKDLINSHVAVLLIVPAGTSRKVSDGFDIPEPAMLTQPYTGK
jgi:hypothetical protein